MFGQVFEGLDVVQKINEVEVRNDGSASSSKPINQVMIEKVEIDISMVPAEQCPDIVGDSAIYIYDALFPMLIPAKESDNLSEIVSYECK